MNDQMWLLKSTPHGCWNAWESPFNYIIAVTCKKIRDVKKTWRLSTAVYGGRSRKVPYCRFTALFSKWLGLSTGIISIYSNILK